MKTICKNIFNITIIVLLFSALSCSREDITFPEKEEDTVEKPDQEGWESTVKATNKGRVVAKVEYGHMVGFSQKKKMKFDQGVVIQFYDQIGNPSSTLSADRGEIDENTNDMYAMGRVIVATDTGITLYTEELAYFQKSEKILSEVDVMVTTQEKDTLYGTGFESDPHMIDWTILKPRGIAHTTADLSMQEFERKKSTLPDTGYISPDSTTGSNLNKIDLETRSPDTDSLLENQTDL